MTRLLPGTSAADLRNPSDLAPFSKIRLVVADLDGTLLDANGSLWTENLPRSVRRLNHYGVAFTLATGRTFSGASAFLEHVRSRPPVPLVLYNGSVVYDAKTKSLLRCVTITDQVVASVIEAIGNLETNVFAYRWETRTGIRMESPGLAERVIGWSVRRPRPRLDFNGKAIEWQASTAVPAGPYVAVLVDVSQLRSDVIRRLTARLTAAPEVSVTASGAAFIELRPAGSNKWEAVLEITKRLNISSSEVLAIGDQLNDIEMLDGAGVGVAVHNAPEPTRAAADYMSRASQAAGVVQVLNTLIEAKHLAKGLSRLGVVK